MKITNDDIIANLPRLKKYAIFLTKNKRGFKPEDLVNDTIINALSMPDKERIYAIPSYLCTIMKWTFYDKLDHLKVENKYKDYVENQMQASSKQNGVIIQEAISNMDHAIMANQCLVALQAIPNPNYRIIMEDTIMEEDVEITLSKTGYKNNFVLNELRKKIRNTYFR